jgi:hypothetical protein
MLCVMTAASAKTFVSKSLSARITRCAVELRLSRGAWLHRVIVEAVRRQEGLPSPLATAVSEGTPEAWLSDDLTPAHAEVHREFGTACCEAETARGRREPPLASPRRDVPMASMEVAGGSPPPIPPDRGDYGRRKAPAVPPR